MRHIDKDNYSFTLQEFRTWLKSKNDNEIVGQARSIKLCPLSKFLQEKVNSDKPYVGCYSTYIFESEIETLDYDNPEWVVSFIRYLDDKFYLCNVTAQQALEILKKVEEEL